MNGCFENTVYFYFQYFTYLRHLSVLFEELRLYENYFEYRSKKFSKILQASIYLFKVVSTTETQGVKSVQSSQKKTPERR